MPRIPRFLFPDGLFHVGARGVAKMPIYHENNDRRNFLSLLAYEHSLVKPGDLRRLDSAFFTVNGLISVVFFGFVLAEAAL